MKDGPPAAGLDTYVSHHHTWVLQDSSFNNARPSSREIYLLANVYVQPP